MKRKRNAKISLKIFFIICLSLLTALVSFVLVVLAGYYTPLLRIIDPPASTFSIEESYVNETRFPQKYLYVHSGHNYLTVLIRPSFQETPNEKKLSLGYCYDEFGNIVIKSQWRYITSCLDMSLTPSSIAYYAIYIKFDNTEGVKFYIDVTDRNKYPRSAIINRLEKESQTSVYPFPYIFQYCFFYYDDLCSILDHFHYDYILKDTDKELNLLSNIDAAYIRTSRKFGYVNSKLEDLNLKHTFRDPIQTILRRRITFEAIDVPVYSFDHSTRYISYAYRGDFTKLYWIGIIVGILVFLLMFFVLIQRMFSYVKIIEKGIVTASEGNLDHRIPVNGSDELAHLADNINQMTNSLRKHIQDEKGLIESRANLITNLSHDLLTPITTIMGYITLLQENKWETQEEKNRYLSAAMNKADQLKNLIQRALNFSLLIKKHTTVSINEIPIDALFKDLRLQLQALACEKNYDLLITKPTYNGFLYGNKIFLERVIGNVMMNATRYGDPLQPITMEIEEEKKFIEIRIQNGIKCDDYSIQTEYLRKKKKYVNERGTGLGLPICEQLMSLQRGYIKTELYHDEFNRCIFSVTLGFLKKLP